MIIRPSQVIFTLTTPLSDICNVLFSCLHPASLREYLVYFWNYTEKYDKKLLSQSINEKHFQLDVQIDCRTAFHQKMFFLRLQSFLKSLYKHYAKHLTYKSVQTMQYPFRYIDIRIAIIIKITNIWSESCQFPLAGKF